MTLLSQFHFKGRQEQAATDPNPAIAVTAGAGSGKTLSLVGRYLHLLERGIPLRSILAITFTEKAAREMRARIRTALSYVSTDIAQDKFSSSILNPASLDSARISTIHSLCAEILRAHPAEAGLDPAFSVLDEGLAAALQAEAVDAALAWAVVEPHVAALFGVFAENDLRQILAALLSRRLDVDFSGKLDGSRLREKFSSALSDYLATQLESLAWLEPLSDLAARRALASEDKLELARQSVLARWDEIRQAQASQNWEALLAALAALRKSIALNIGRKDAWDVAALESTRQDMSQLKDIYDEHLKFLAEKSRFALDEQVAVCLPAITMLFDQTLREYQHRKDDRQALDFDDLESLSARLLTGQPAVRARLQSELRAVLVDEFQDTNERQRQIVYALTGFAPSPIGAVSTSEAGSRAAVDLFLVGDSKQSIYRFRQADVTVFRQVQSDIQSAGGQIIDLDLTFRAHKALLEGLNGLLAPILGETDDPARPCAVPFSPLRAYRQTPVRENIQPPFIEFHLGLGETAEEGRVSAASALARRLRQLHESEGFAWGDMALLFRSSTAFPVYETAFEKAAIPFVTVAGRGFYDRPEIRDLLNALAAIADPGDDLALVGLLRSPAFAIPDADLYRLRFNRAEERSNRDARGAHENDQNKLDVLGALRASSLPAHQRAYSILTELHDLSGRVPAAAILKRLLDLTAYRAILASAPNGARLVRNVDKLLADAHRSRLVSLAGFLAYVQTLRDVGLREGEAPADSASSGAVQLMTVHKAKGLEFPLTVLADASYEHRGARAKIQLAPESLLLDLRDADDLHPSAWQLAARLEENRDDAEDRRLLYVAATRAKEKLLVSAHVKLKKDNTLSLAGWLERLGAVIGLDEIFVDMSQPGNIPLNTAGLSLTLYPAAVEPGSDSPQLEPVSTDSVSPIGRAPDLIGPIAPAIPVADEEARSRESDPPQRVWRVVFTAKHPRAPAWLVGRLVHESLRRWRFPAAEGFENFLRPLALEAGLTDSAEIHAAIQESRRLLERLRAHPIFTEMDSAERHHEVPYFLSEGRGVMDLLYRTPAGWCLADFKTDEVSSDEVALQHIQEKEYDKQVARYADAVFAQLGIRPKTMLVFLQVGAEVKIYS